MWRKRASVPKKLWQLRSSSITAERQSMVKRRGTQILPLRTFYNESYGAPPGPQKIQSSQSPFQDFTAAASGRPVAAGAPPSAPHFSPSAPFAPAQPPPPLRAAAAGPSPAVSHYVPPPVSTPAAAPGTDYLVFFPPRSTRRRDVVPFSSGQVYKLLQLSRDVLKEDILHYFRGCHLKPEDIKFVYSPLFNIIHVQLKFDSNSSYRQLQGNIKSHGSLGIRGIKLESGNVMPWNFIDAILKDVPRGRTLVMMNVNPLMTFEDVERFFQGYDYDPCHISFIHMSRDQQGIKQQLRHVAIGFFTTFEAMRALREKKGEFCLNQGVKLRLIQ